MCFAYQDLSLGWLDCNPEPIYLPTTFRLADLPDNSPGPIADFLLALGRLTPAALKQLLSPILDFSFVARPMQVAAPCHAHAAVPASAGQPHIHSTHCLCGALHALGPV